MRSTGYEADGFQQKSQTPSAHIIYCTGKAENCVGCVHDTDKGESGWDPFSSLFNKHPKHLAV